MTVTVAVYEPSSTYVWLPVTVKWLALPEIVPAEVAVPSPQSIVAAYWLAGTAVSVTKNVATVPLNVAPSVA